MYRVVIPLSALPPRPPGIPWAAVIDEIFAHIFLVGLPVSLLAARSARRAAWPAYWSLPPRLRSSSSSAFIQVEMEVSSSSFTFLPRARLILRRILR